MSEHETERLPAGVLGKASQVVEALAAEPMLTPAEIAEICDIPRSSIYRILDGLVNVGLATAAPGGEMRLSLAWLGMADAACRSMEEWADAREVLDGITAATEMTSFLTVLQGDATVCVECSQGRSIDALMLRVGRVLPLFAGAAGRVALAYMDAAWVDRYLSRAPFPAFNENTLTEADQLREDIALTLRRGYALSNEDVTLGVGAVGVPLLRDGKVIGSLSAGGFVDEVLRMEDSLVQCLRQGAKSLGFAL